MTLQTQFVFTWEIELRIENSRRMKISYRIETRFRFMYRQSYFPGDFSTYTPKLYVNKTSYFPNNLYFGYNERRFHSEFHSRVKFRSKFTRFRIDISFRIESSIRKKLRGMNSISRSGMSCNSIRIYINKYNSIRYDLNRNGMSSD